MISTAEIYSKIFEEDAMEPNTSMTNTIIDYYEAIISNMPGNVYWLDKNGITIGCNKNVLDMFGFSSIEQFRGLSFEKMAEICGWTKEAEEKFKSDTMHVIMTGEPILNSEEPPIKHNDGRWQYFLTSRVPVFDKKNNVVSVIGISIDISDRKESERLKIEKMYTEKQNKLVEIFCGRSCP